MLLCFPLSQCKPLWVGLGQRCSTGVGAGEKSAVAGTGPSCVSSDIHENLCHDVHVNDCCLLQVNLWVCVGARGKGGAKC